MKAHDQRNTQIALRFLSKSFKNITKNCRGGRKESQIWIPLQKAVLELIDANGFKIWIKTQL